LERKKHLLVVFATITLLSPLSGIALSRVHAESSFPDYPKPAHLGTPVLTDVPLQINVLFLGIPQNVIDVQRIQAQLEPWYTQINRERYIARGEMEMYVNFTLRYNFLFVAPALADAYAQFVSTQHVEYGSPFWLKRNAPTAWYVDAYLAETWLKNNLNIPNEGYTLIIIDTSHTSQPISNYYFYNGTVPDPDTNQSPKQFTSTYMIGYGGTPPNRSLFLDLSAGPTCYFSLRNCPNDAGVRHIDSYDFTNPDDMNAFNSDLGGYIRNAVDLAFVPSPLYRPIYRDSFYLNATIFSADPTTQYSNYLNMTHIVSVLRALVPLSNFTGSVQEVPIQNYPGLYSTVIAATNEDRSVDSSKIGNYFLQNYRHYVANSGKFRVLPIFIIGGYLFNGEAYPARSGNFAFVLKGINQTDIGRGIGLTYTILHETSHALGLPHPHDGFDWGLYRTGIGGPPGEFAFWPYDFSGSLTTYALDNIFPDQMNYDERDIGTTALVLNSTYTYLDLTKKTLDYLGAAPTPLLLEDVQHALYGSKVAIGNLSLPNPDYYQASINARAALNFSKSAYFEAKALTSITNTTTTSSTVPEFTNEVLAVILVVTLSFVAVFSKVYRRR